MCLSVLGRGSLSQGVSVGGSLFRKVSVQGGLCLRGLCWGGLCPGGLCWGFYVHIQGVSVQGSLPGFPGVSVQGDVCPGGLCPGESLSRGSLSGRVSVHCGFVQGSLCPWGSLSMGVSVRVNIVLRFELKWFWNKVSPKRFFKMCFIELNGSNSKRLFPGWTMHPFGYILRHWALLRLYNAQRTL